MKTIGMIVAVELQSVLKRYGAKLVKRKETAGYQVLEYETDQYRMVIVNCGPGEIAAADLCLEVVEKIVAGMGR